MTAPAGEVKRGLAVALVTPPLERVDAPSASSSDAAAEDDSPTRPSSSTPSSVSSTP